MLPRTGSGNTSLVCRVTESVGGEWRVKNGLRIQGWLSLGDDILGSVCPSIGSSGWALETLKLYAG